MLFANHDVMPSGLPSITSFHPSSVMSPGSVGYEQPSSLVTGHDVPNTTQQTGAALGKALASVSTEHLVLCKEEHVAEMGR